MHMFKKMMTVLVIFNLFTANLSLASTRNENMAKAKEIIADAGLETGFENLSLAQLRQGLNEMEELYRQMQTDLAKAEFQDDNNSFFIQWRRTVTLSAIGLAVGITFLDFYKNGDGPDAGGSLFVDAILAAGLASFWIYGYGKLFLTESEYEKTKKTVDELLQQIVQIEEKIEQLEAQKAEALK